MPDEISFTEIEEQHVELIPGRTLMQTGPLYEDTEGIHYDDLYDDDLYDDVLYFDDLFFDDELDEDIEPHDASATDPPHYGSSTR